MRHKQNKVLRKHKSKRRSIAPTQMQVTESNLNVSSESYIPTNEKEYFYTKNGMLVYKGFSYSKTVVNGLENVVYWKCADCKKFKCVASLKTKGKNVTLVRDNHNHVPRKVKAFNPVIWT